jgi:hypothetical protein
MQTATYLWRRESGVFQVESGCSDANLALYFGPNQDICDPRFLQGIRAACPDARILGCTTGTSILGADLEDDAALFVAVKFQSTRVRVASAPVSVEGSREAGMSIGRDLAAPDLAGVFVLCDSLNVDGMELVAGMHAGIGANIPISGGLASDGSNFRKTMVGADSPPAERTVGAIGFYGETFAMGQGCAHGWDDFGPPRTITRAEGNVLYELDGKPALDLYVKYLADDAADLPGSALRFPLLVSDPADPSRQVIRTVLDVDHEARTLTFASAIPSGWRARLMRGALDHLADGAGAAATQAMTGVPSGTDGLAILVSCVGRRIVFGSSVADETEAVHRILSPNFQQVGFYSHGEISSADKACFGLHNQTMTIVTLREAA